MHCIWQFILWGCALLYTPLSERVGDSLRHVGHESYKQTARLHFVSSVIWRNADTEWFRADCVMAWKLDLNNSAQVEPIMYYLVCRDVAHPHAEAGH